MLAMPDNKVFLFESMAREITHPADMALFNKSLVFVISSPRLYALYSLTVC